jgi:chemotaxis signal transduction protein
MVFDCGARRFATPFADVERLAVMPSVIHPIQAPKPILGRSRDDGSLVVSLADALGIEAAAKPRIVVVVSRGAKEVAFTADHTTGVQQGVLDADGRTLILPDGSKAEQVDMKALADRFARPVDETRGPMLPLAKPRDTPAGGRTRLMTIRVNESWYGLSADLVRRVGAPTGYARLYGDSCRFDGIAIVGGDAVPAIDLHRVFRAPRRHGYIAAVMSTRDGTVAVMCDALGRIEDVQTDRIEAADTPFIAGRVSRSTQTIHLIDLRRIVQPDRAA